MQLQTKKEKTASDEKLADSAAKIEALDSKIEDLDQAVGSAYSYIDSFETRMLAGLAKNVSLTPSTTQFAKL